MAKIGNKAVPGTEIADVVAKGAFRLDTEPGQEIRKSVKTIYNKI